MTGTFSCEGGSGMLLRGGVIVRGGQGRCRASEEEP